MSGSYDRPGGRRDSAAIGARLRPLRRGDDRAAYGRRARSAITTAPQRRRAARRTRVDMHAPARPKRGERKQTNAPVVPADSVTGRSLTLVISIMCFLACLTAGAVYMINESANAWLKDIASEVTVQVEPRPDVDTEKTVTDAETYMGRQPGIARAKALSLDESIEAARALARKIGRARCAAGAAPHRYRDRPRCAARHRGTARRVSPRSFPGATLDDHRHWQRQIRTVTRSFALGGLGILLLVAAATTAIIVSATRSVDGLQPRDRRGAALRGRNRPLHRARVREALFAARHPRRARRRAVRHGACSSPCPPSWSFWAAATSPSPRCTGSSAPAAWTSRATLLLASWSSSSRRSVC